jgi:hypothetical protein
MEDKKMIKKRTIEIAVAEARVYGDSFLGETCFDVIKDSKKVYKYLKDNNITDCFLHHVSDTAHDDGWYIVCVR